MLISTCLTPQLCYVACWRSNRQVVWAAYFTLPHSHGYYCPLTLDILSNDEETLKFREHFWTVTSEKWNLCGPGFGVGLLKGDYIGLLLWFEVLGSMSISTRAARIPLCQHGWALQGPFLSSASWHVGWGHGNQGQSAPAGRHRKLSQIPPWSTASTCRS